MGSVLKRKNDRNTEKYDSRKILIFMFLLNGTFIEVKSVNFSLSCSPAACEHSEHTESSHPWYHYQKNWDENKMSRAPWPMGNCRIPSANTTRLSGWCQWTFSNKRSFPWKICWEARCTHETQHLLSGTGRNHLLDKDRRRQLNICQWKLHLALLRLLACRGGTGWLRLSGAQSNGWAHR